jgi:hypothetical protein
VPGLDRVSVHEYLDVNSAERAPYTLGPFPRTVFRLIRDELLAMGVEVFVIHEPREQPLPKLLLIDEEDYIIAEDFQDDVPEFEHREEWCRRS